MEARHSARGSAHRLVLSDSRRKTELACHPEQGRRKTALVKRGKAPQVVSAGLARYRKPKWPVQSDRQTGWYRGELGLSLSKAPFVPVVDEGIFVSTLTLALSLLGRGDNLKGGPYEKDHS